MTAVADFCIGTTGGSFAQWVYGLHGRVPTLLHKARSYYT